MGVKHSTPTSGVATEFASSSSDTTHPANGRFGMPHAKTRGFEEFWMPGHENPYMSPRKIRCRIRVGDHWFRVTGCIRMDGTEASAFRGALEVRRGLLWHTLMSLK